MANVLYQQQRTADIPRGFTRLGRSHSAPWMLDRRLSVALILTVLVFPAGCSLFQKPEWRPLVHNPFPQIHKIAVAPFFNLSTDPTLDGRKVAIAYYNELQEVPGFEVIPVGVVERAMFQHRISLNNPQDVRHLAQLLGADAVVIGAVTEYSPYYPPRCGLQVEWYAANPGFCPVPPGYGLPWGTKEEKDIPSRLVLESQLAYAREALRNQSPQAADASATDAAAQPGFEIPQTGEGKSQASLSPEGLIPKLAQAGDSACGAGEEPFMKHTRVYNGGDSQLVKLLQDYAKFRDDARLGGWQSYLTKSEEFLRFCCRVHIWEMLTARGGADESELVWSTTSGR
ncbi:MAG TPA: hypothetical protein PKI05_13045 [Thermogutta sp.]|nr:hypothetical protein [Thermogutta sp.]HQF12594.1 hypothetical protein [Thermogutta sp.]